MKDAEQRTKSSTMFNCLSVVVNSVFVKSGVRNVRVCVPNNFPHLLHSTWCIQPGFKYHFPTLDQGTTKTK